MNALKMWRMERQLSQYELSEASGVMRWAIQLYEQGIRFPKPRDQKALAEALGINAEDLLPDQDCFDGAKKLESSSDNGKRP